MRRKITALVLLALMVMALLPGVQGLSPLCFVANNDSLPVILSSGESPFYSNGSLYIPYNAFDASPNGVGASYNAEKNTLVLFNNAQTLLFDLKERTYTDKQRKTYEIKLIYRGGVLYIPSDVADHFDLSVTLLFSRYGYPIIRFTNGSEVYDDGTFVAQAENLIDRAAEKYDKEYGGLQENYGGLHGNILDGLDDNTDPVNVYLAFIGEAVSAETLNMLTSMSAKATFFVTGKQIADDPDLVRDIYAAGHTVGLTVGYGENNVVSAIRKANDALDSVLFFRSVFVLMPSGFEMQTKSYCVLPEPAAKTVESVLSAPNTQHLMVVRSGGAAVISELVEGGATLLCLRETTF